MLSSLSPPASMATGTIDKENGENGGGQLCISDSMFTGDELLTASRATHIPVISELPRDGGGTSLEEEMTHVPVAGQPWGSTRCGGARCNENSNLGTGRFPYCKLPIANVRFCFRVTLF